jgi:hypothetical protein
MKWFWRFSSTRSEEKEVKIGKISIFGFQCATQATKTNKEKREREITMVPNAVGGFDVIFVPLKLFPRWNRHYQAYSITHNGSWSVSPNPSPMRPNTPGLYTHNGTIVSVKHILLISFVQNSMNQVHGAHSRTYRDNDAIFNPETQPKMSHQLYRIQ